MVNQEYMGSSVNASKRHQIIAAYKKGNRISTISKEYQVSRGMIYNLLSRYEKEGEKGLKPKYSNCGKSRPTEKDFLYRAIRCMRTWHPTWGSEKIQAEIHRLRPNLKLPTTRTMNRWFHWNNQLQVKTKLPSTDRTWAKNLHDVWQIDAKESMLTQNGENNCWLNVVDEYSGAPISPIVFSL